VRQLYLNTGAADPYPDDVVTIDLSLPVRVIEPHPRIDALRGCVAIERGPLVYCFEGIDQPGVNLTDLRLDPEAVCEAVEWVDRLGGIVALRMHGRLADVDEWGHASIERRSIERQRHAKLISPPSLTLRGPIAKSGRCACGCQNSKHKQKKPCVDTGLLNFE
jgi:DUF1680 family protein